MAVVEPVPDAPAAVADAGGRRLLVLADYHAGVEAALRSEGVELESRGQQRRERLLELVERVGAEEVVVIGDLTHDIGGPIAEEQAEIAALTEALSVELTVVKGNHDGAIEEAVAGTVVGGEGTRRGSVGVTHGHVWPTAEVLAAEVVCVGHEHPTVRINDEVGGSRIERAWLRGPLDPAPFETRPDGVDADLVVFPAFNELVGGTWVNGPDVEFLSPFLPAALPAGEAFLLDGTRLGGYRAV